MKKIIISILAIFFISFFVFLLVPSKNSESMLFDIDRGEGLFEISKKLENQGIIKSNILMNALGIITGQYNNIQAGTYELSPSMSVSSVLRTIASGIIFEDKLTIIEGWTIDEIKKELDKKGFKFDIKKEDYDFGFLEYIPDNMDLEGFLFPDTYFIKRGDNMENIGYKILSNFQEKTEDLDFEDDIYKIITMASMVEREVIGYEDKQIVAGILWKRLKYGWPLQVDATISYITKNNTILKTDFEIDSPYNTYKYRGLPKGPISNPGLESIKASLYYENSPYWFYLTTKEGETIFSKTLEEHNINVYKYLK